VIDVEQRALRAFEQQAITRGHRRIQPVRHVADHRFQPLGQAQGVVDHFCASTFAAFR